MLAYVFWHSAAPEEAGGEYDQRLQAFHRALAHDPPAGLLASHTWRVTAVPWLGGEGHEDWYLLEDAGALDPLAVGAVSGRTGSVHDAIARLAAGGTAGLYKPAYGQRAEVAGPIARWFGKPAGITYGDFFTVLERQDPTIRQRLWQRFLTLGPTPEFCLIGESPRALETGSDVLVVHRQGSAHGQGAHDAGGAGGEGLS